MVKNGHIEAHQFDRQPFWFRAINKVWKASYAVGTRTDLSKDGLIRAARKATGLNDFGKDFWEEPMDRMLDSIHHEAQLHPIGAFITRERLVQLLSVRLRAENWFKKHPEILEQPLYPVLMIIGLQRTGTTKLQRLLASDPENRSLLSWEALNPAPLNGDFKTGDNRIKAARTSEKALKYMSPGFFAIHPVEHQAPEEDVLLLDVSFLSTTAEATMHVPSYAQWLEQTDQSPAYEYMVKLLKLLQWQRPAKRWILKTPHHLEFLPLVKKHLGDVELLWTHRNILESIPSFMSMVSYARILFSERVSQKDVAQHWLKKTAFMLSKAMDFHEQDKNNKEFIHISYSELVDYPMDVIKNIYDKKNIPFNQEKTERFERTILQNPQGKYGWHRYSLNDFGLDEQTINETMERYRRFSAGLFPVPKTEVR
jgi:hypothetical protein